MTIVNGEYPAEYAPTVISWGEAVHRESGIRFQFEDTAGQDDYDTLRPLCYPGTTVIWICFNIANRRSLESVRSKWIPELQHHLPTTPWIFVGCKEDLRTDDAFIQAHPQADFVSEDELEQLASEFGSRFILTSAKSGLNLAEVLNVTVEVVLQHSEKNGRSKPKISGGQKMSQCFLM